MEMMGTELSPDWFSLGTGEYSRESYKDNKTIFFNRFDTELPLLNILTSFSDTSPIDTAALYKSGYSDEMIRVIQSLPRPYKRFHYRYFAVKLLDEAAALLNDNDILLAKVLYEAGVVFKNKETEIADKYYKKLVYRCPKLKAAQLADKQRWFPEKKEFYDLFNK